MEHTCLNTEKRAMAMGFFDGIHAGHAALLECAVRRASQIGGIPSVLSFDVHPDTLVFNAGIRLISDTETRKEILSRCFGIRDVVLVHFDERMKNLPWQDFAAYVVNELNAAWLVVGYDFTFGAGGKGNAEKLRAWCEDRGVGCDIVDPVMIDGQIVSSTLIRSLIESGNISEANRFLVHPYCISISNLTDPIFTDLTDSEHTGQIRIAFPDDSVIPLFGAYAAKTVLSDGSEHRSVVYIGNYSITAGNYYVPAGEHSAAAGQNFVSVGNRFTVGNENGVSANICLVDDTGVARLHSAPIPSAEPSPVHAAVPVSMPAHMLEAAASYEAAPITVPVPVRVDFFSLIRPELDSNSSASALSIPVFSESSSKAAFDDELAADAAYVRKYQFHETG